MLPEDQKRILGYFIEEAKDHLNTIEQGLLNLQATIEDAEMVNEVFRAAHSVKGGAAMLGLESIQLTSHRLEDYFKVLKESPVQADRQLESMLLQIFDGLQEQLEQLQGPFGLTDDKAKEIIATLEPVFGQVHQHLETLVAAAAARPVAPSPPVDSMLPAATAGQPHPETSALQLVFRSDVPAQLRTMLGLFKQADCAETRQDIQAICLQLGRIGEQFELPAWCALVDAARRVVGNQQQTFRTLAPLLIKEIKSGQDLVLAGQANRIMVSLAMQDLLPPESADDPLAAASLDALLEEALSDTSADADLIDFFGPGESGGATADLGLLNSDAWMEEAASTDSSADLADLISFEGLEGNSDPLLYGVDQGGVGSGSGPEVGAAELNSLADLFEGDASALNDVWEEEELIDSAAAGSGASSLDFEGDFADLLSTEVDAAPSSQSEDEELANLFGDSFLADGLTGGLTEPEEPWAAAPGTDAAGLPDFLDFADAGLAYPDSSSLTSDELALESFGLEELVLDSPELASPEIDAVAADADAELGEDDFDSLFDSPASADGQPSLDLSADLWDAEAAPESGPAAPDAADAIALAFDDLTDTAAVDEIAADFGFDFEDETSGEQTTEAAGFAADLESLDLNSLDNRLDNGPDDSSLDPDALSFDPLALSDAPTADLAEDLLAEFEPLAFDAELSEVPTADGSTETSFDLTFSDWEVAVEPGPPADLDLDALAFESELLAETAEANPFELAFEDASAAALEPELDFDLDFEPSDAELTEAPDASESGFDFDNFEVDSPAASDPGLAALEQPDAADEPETDALDQIDWSAEQAIADASDGLALELNGDEDVTDTLEAAPSRGGEPASAADSAADAGLGPDQAAASGNTASDLETDLWDDIAPSTVVPPPDFSSVDDFFDLSATSAPAEAGASALPAEEDRFDDDGAIAAAEPAPASLDDPRADELLEFSAEDLWQTDNGDPSAAVEVAIPDDLELAFADLPTLEIDDLTAEPAPLDQLDADLSGDQLSHEPDENAVLGSDLAGNELDFGDQLDLGSDPPDSTLDFDIDLGLSDGLEVDAAPELILDFDALEAEPDTVAEGFSDLADNLFEPTVDLTSPLEVSLSDPFDEALAEADTSLGAEFDLDFETALPADSEAQSTAEHSLDLTSPLEVSLGDPFDESLTEAEDSLASVFDLSFESTPPEHRDPRAAAGDSFDDLDLLLNDADLGFEAAEAEELNLPEPVAEPDFNGLADETSRRTAPGFAAAASFISGLESSDSEDEFEDLEKLLEEADQLGGSPPALGLRRSQAAARRSPRRANGLADQTMRVSVKHLDNLSNLVGELVVNRNSLEQDQERLRQFLDNLLFQVQQLNDVGQRMRDLYERSLLESSLMSSRQSFQSAGLSESNGSHATGVTFDALEMDRFTGFHTLSQEMIELIVRVRESSSDIAFTIESTDQITRQFRQVTTQLQEGLNKARMVPFAQTADRLPRAVRDISLKCGKEAKLVVEGRDTLIDKMILERLYDPMTHLVNNAITHGVETPEERLAAGKPREGTITVRAFYQGNQTVIYIADDGAGINSEVVKEKAVKRGLATPAEARAMTRLDVYELLFMPGFSTRDQADDFAGRGVGMDVVRTALSEIRGSVTIDSELGKGTSFTIRLPLTLSISKALSCVNNQARLAFPMDGVEDMFDAPRDRVQVNDQGQSCILWRDTLLPFRPLSDLLQFNRTLGRGRVYGGHQEDDIISIVVLRSANAFIALEVDQVIGEQEIVIKQLEGPVPKPTGIAGATVLGDGRVMPIADVLELIDLSMGRVRRDPAVSLWSQTDDDRPLIVETPAQAEPTVLIVDDSITVRELLKMSFNKVGYRVEQARDGQEAWEKLRSGLPCDLVFCDIEMPRMDGLELLSRMQKDSVLCQVPIAMLTSRGADRHRQMAVDLGAKGYFTKPYLEEMLLDAAQRMLNGEDMVGPRNHS